MKFKVGDKVQVTKDFLLRLPFLSNETKGGGIVANIDEKTAYIKFYSGHNYFIYHRSLELINMKGRQLLFDFMT